MADDMRNFVLGLENAIIQRQQARRQQQMEWETMIMKSQYEQRAKQQQQAQVMQMLQGLFANQGGMGGQGMGQGGGQMSSFGQQGGMTNPQAYMSGVDLETGMPKISFQSPSEQMNLQEKLKAQAYQNRLGQYQMARNIPEPSLNLVKAPQQQIRQSLQARGVRNLLSPEFGKKSEFTRDTSGQWKQLTPRERTGTDLMTASKLRQEFINRPEVKEFVTVATNVRSMDSMLNSAIKGNINNRVALDQALITMYNKLTDPNSVVRESEYARTPENLPLFNRFGGALDKLKKGGAGMTNQDRQALVWGAKIIANERGKTFNTTYEDYNMLAREYGIKPELVLRGMDKFQEYSNQEQGGQVNNQDVQPLQIFRVKQIKR